MTELMNDEEYARQLQAQEFHDPLPSYKDSSANNSQEIKQPLLETNIDATNIDTILNDTKIDNNNDDSKDNDNKNNDDFEITYNNKPRKELLDNFMEHSDNSFIVLIHCMYSMAEMMATASVLSTDWIKSNHYMECNLLRIWIFMYTLRHVVQLPLRIYMYRQRNVETSDSNANNDRNVNISVNYDDSINTDHQSKCKKCCNFCIKCSGKITDFIRNTCINRIKPIYIFRFIKIAQILWFLLGQSFLFISHDCNHESPSIWNYYLILIILVYTAIFVPSIIWICFPCLLKCMDWFDRIFDDPPINPNQNNPNPNPNPNPDPNASQSNNNQRTQNIDNIFI